MRKWYQIIGIFLISIFIAQGLGSCRSKGPYNPYLKMKTKPSEKQAKENKKVIKKGNRAYRKKEESSRKHLFGRKHAK